MVLLNFTAGTASTPLSITKVFNTNFNTSVASNAINLKVPGVYEIQGSITLTSAAAGNYGVTVYANGSAIGSAFVNSAAAASETTTIPMYYAVKVADSTDSGYVAITFVPTGSPTVVSGSASIKRIS